MKVRLFILLVFFLICFFTILAEVSTVKNSDNNYSSYIFMYRDFPYNEIWEKFSNNPNSISLNENGDLNSDGKPSFAINPLSGFPEVVWSKFDGNDFEIAYSYFDGSQWSSYEIITNNNINDLDPCIAFSDDGIAKISWWTDESIQQVYYKIREEDGNWSIELIVSDPLENSKYPSITPSGNLSYFAYENPISSNFKNIIIGEIIDDPDPFPQLLFKTNVGSAAYDPNSKAKPYSVNGHLWIDWIYDENFICWSEKIGNEWTPQRYERYSGPEDIIRIRLHVRMKVLNGQ